MPHHPALPHVNRPLHGRATRFVAATVTAGVLCACSTPRTTTQPGPQSTGQTPETPAQQAASNLAAFSTVLTGTNQVPPLRRSATGGTGQVDAVLDKTTRLLRWKLSYRGLTGVAIAGHFHGPAPVGATAGVTRAFKGPLTSRMDGQATLTPAQMAELLAGKWYVNIHTRAYPGGEIRGQMILRE